MAPKEPSPPKQPKPPKRKKGDPPEEPSLLEKISSYFTSPFKSIPIPKTPVSGMKERMTNMMTNNFRGVIGVLVPLACLSHRFQRFNPQLKMWLMWQWMAWFYLVQPIAVPCTSMIPIFYLPMVGIYNSLYTCKCYMNEGIMLYITSAYLLVMLNNSGIDKRIGLWFLSLGNDSKFSGKMLVLKASAAAFFLSIFSSRLIAAHNLIEIMTSAFERVEPSHSLSLSKGSADITAMRHIVNNAIQTSASIGGLGIIHSSWITLLFRACYNECVQKDYENPDIFNYLQYSAFAFPVVFGMFIANLIYHIILMIKFEGSGLSGLQTGEIKNMIFRHQDEIPLSISLHEMYSVLFTILLLAALFTRNSKFMTGWAFPVENLEVEPSIYRVKDATVTAIFVIILHIIPKSFGFLKLFAISYREDLPPLKPESAILWWRFVDKNVNYGYLFTFGSAIALLRAGIETKLSKVLIVTIGSNVTEQSFNIGILMCILISAVLCNIMTAMAACSIFLPYILLLASDSPIPWPTHYFIPALGIGLASNLGFCIPFQYTPAYYCHHTGRVPILSMVKYSVPSVLICALIIYAGVTKYAPAMFDESLLGVKAVPATKSAIADFKKKLEDFLKNRNLPTAGLTIPGGGSDSIITGGGADGSLPKLP